MRVLIFSVVLLLINNWAFGQSSERSDIRKGNRYYADSNYVEAGKKYLDAWDKDANLVEAMYNIGDVYYQQDSMEKAVEMFEVAAKLSEDDLVKAKAYHNLGNIHLKEKSYKKSIDAYKESLKLNPNDMDTKYNLSYAAGMLKKQPPPQQQEKEQDGDGEKEQEKNQENEEKKDQENKEKKDGPNQQEQEDNEQEAEEGKSKEKPKPKDYDGDQEGETQPEVAQLSKEEAERLLEALKQEEQKIQNRLIKAKMKRDNSKVEKDW